MCQNLCLTDDADPRSDLVLGQARCILTNQPHSVQLFFTRLLTGAIVGESGCAGRLGFWNSKGIGCICASDACFNHPMKPISSIRNFCKTARCPSSEMLLRYRRRHVTITERLSTEKHLRECDFCSAELQLLQRHQVEVEEPRVAEMPSNLRRLAENFLGNTRELSQMGLVIRSPLSH